MATGKKYYWIKLKKEFLTGDKIDFLMAQNGGAQYVVLYLLLCMMCINTEGKLEKQIGDMIVPFSMDKIQRDCKYFDKDTILVAMELYKRLGMICRNGEGTLIIDHYEDMIGSESDYSVQKRRQRNTKRIGVDSTTDNDADKHVDTTMSKCVDEGVDNVHTENRDQSSESREQSLEPKDQSSELKKQSLRIQEVDHSSPSLSTTMEARRSESIRCITNAWNSLSDVGIAPISRLSKGTQRYRSVTSLLNEYGESDILKAIDRIKKSNFLQGKGPRCWVISFDWFIQPNNFPKVLDGNYDNEKQRQIRKADSGPAPENNRSLMAVWGIGG